MDADRYDELMDMARLEAVRKGLTREMTETTLRVFLMSGTPMTLTHADALIALHTATVELERAKEGL